MKTKLILNYKYIIIILNLFLVGIIGWNFIPRIRIDNKLKNISESISNYEFNSILLSLNIKTIPILDDSFVGGNPVFFNCGKKLLIADRAAKVFQIINDTTINKIGEIPILNGRNLYLTEKGKSSDHGGVLRIYDIKIKEENLYTSYQRYIGNNKTRMIVSKIKIDCELDNGEILFKNNKDIYVGEIEGNDSAKTTHDAGGAIAIFKNNVLLAIGNTSSDLPHAIKKGELYSLAQDDNVSFGKIIIIDDNGDNYHVAKGIRNPQGMTVNLTNDKIYFVDHGPMGGDEVNVLPSDLINKDKNTYTNNYGWPYHSNGVNYGTYSLWMPDAYKIFKKMKNEKYIEPLFSFVPSIGISNILVSNSFNQKWDGDLLVTSLKAQTLYRLRLDESKTRILYSEPIFIGKRIRDIIIYENSIYLTTDDPVIIKITSNNVFERKSRDVIFENKIIAEKCLICHAATPSTPNMPAPTLWKIFGKKIGTDVNFNYSQNFYNQKYKESVVFDSDTLRRFISNPSSVIPGSRMPSANISDSELDSIINTLKDN